MGDVVAITVTNVGPDWAVDVTSTVSSDIGKDVITQIHPPLAPGLTSQLKVMYCSA